jgi:hypothetical protein
MIKKTLIAVLLFVCVAPAAFAGTIDPLNEGAYTAPGSLTSKSGVEGLVVALVRWVYTIFFVLAVFFILLAAYNFLQGGSNEAKVKTAKAQLKWAVIAIAIALLSTAASLIINSVFQIQ